MIKTVTARLPDGRQIPVQYRSSPLMDLVVSEVLSGTEYPLLDFLQTQGSVILDLGANVGCASIIFAARYPQATIYALEPGREAFDFLVRNVAPLPNVRPFRIGACNQDRLAEFYRGNDGSVTSSLYRGALVEQSPREAVQLRRISSFIREQSISRISILKLDTEGAELPILTDLAELLPRIDAIHVEFHSESDRLAIDRIVAPHFTLFQGRITQPHRGLLLYVAKSVLRARTKLDAMEITRP